MYVCVCVWSCQSLRATPVYSVCHVADWIFQFLFRPKPFFSFNTNTAGLSLFWPKQLVWFLWSHLSKSPWSDAKLYACYWKIFCLVACKYLSVTCLFSIHWLLLSSLVFMSVDINCKGEFLFHIFQISFFFFLPVFLWFVFNPKWMSTSQRKSSFCKFCMLINRILTLDSADG